MIILNPMGLYRHDSSDDQKSWKLSPPTAWEKFKSNFIEILFFTTIVAIWIVIIAHYV